MGFLAHAEVGVIDGGRPAVVTRWPHFAAVLDAHILLAPGRILGPNEGKVQADQFHARVQKLCVKGHRPLILDVVAIAVLPVKRPEKVIDGNPGIRLKGIRQIVDDLQLDAFEEDVGFPLVVPGAPAMPLSLPSVAMLATPVSTMLHGSDRMLGRVGFLDQPIR
jgi:hypothetical protein